MKLIDKSALVAEIRNRINNITREYQKSKPQLFLLGKINGLENIISFIDTIDTLEVKEVDLEKEIKLYKMRNPIIQHREESLYDYMSNVAKHFFELGTKAQKEE